MSRFTLSINLDSADKVSDLAGIADIFTPSGRHRIDPDCLIGLLSYLNLGVQTKLFIPVEPGSIVSNLDEINANKWLYIAEKFEEVARIIKDNVTNT